MTSINFHGAGSFSLAEGMEHPGLPGPGKFKAIAGESSKEIRKIHDDKW